MKKQKKNNTIGIRLNDLEYKQLNTIIEENGLSISESVKYAISTAYLLTRNEEQKAKDVNFAVEGLFKRMDYLVKKNEILEKLIYKQDEETKSTIKEYEEMEKKYYFEYRNQLSIEENTN
jgi:hypothetical protein